jgi:hypothetical protein
MDGTYNSLTVSFCKVKTTVNAPSSRLHRWRMKVPISPQSHFYVLKVLPNNLSLDDKFKF